MVSISFYNSTDTEVEVQPQARSVKQVSESKKICEGGRQSVRVSDASLCPSVLVLQGSKEPLRIPYSQLSKSRTITITLDASGRLAIAY